MAILCLSGLSSYPLACREASGVQDIWVWEWNTLTGTSFTYSPTGIITGTTGNQNFTIYNLPQRIETAEYKPGVLKQSNSTFSYESTLTFQLGLYAATLRNLTVSLARHEVQFIVQGQNGKYYVMGEENGALLQENENSIGKELNSMNGSTFNFLAKGQYPDREMSSTCFATNFTLA